MAAEAAGERTTERNTVSDDMKTRLRELEELAESVEKSDVEPSSPKPDKPISKYEAKLLQEVLNRPTPLPTVVVRCLREHVIWEITHSNGRTEKVRSGVLLRAQFDKKYKKGSGCFGGHYVGHATGELLTREEPQTMPDMAVQLEFDPDEGFQFHCSTGTCNLKPLTKADYLVLMENCSARVINPS